MSDVPAQVESDIAVIKNQISNLSENFSEFKNDYKKVLTDTTNKLNTVENKQIATAQKVSNMTVFQSVFSIIIGGIATYLGIRK